MSDSTTPRDDENPSDPTAPLWADPTAPMSQEPPSAGSSEPGGSTPEPPAGAEEPAAPTPPPAAPPAPPSQGTAYPYGQQPPQSPYAPPQPGQPSPYAPQQGQTPYPPQQGQTPYPPQQGQLYPPQQAPYGQQPYWAQHGQQPPGTPGYYQNPAVSPSNTSGIVLVIISALATLSTCVIGIPSLVIGIMALNANATDPAGSRRKSRTGWIVFGINVAVVVLLAAVFITIAVVTSRNSTSYNGTY